MSFTARNMNAWRGSRSHNSTGCEKAGHTATAGSSTNPLGLPLWLLENAGDPIRKVGQDICVWILSIKGTWRGVKGLYHINAVDEVTQWEVVDKRDTRNFIEPGTFLFKAEPVDQYGNLIDRHNLWEMVGVRYRRSLFPGYSDTVEYNVMCPSGGPSVEVRSGDDVKNFSVTVARPGTLRIDAILHYRKIDQFLLNYVMGEKAGLTAPVVDIASTTASVCVSRAGVSGGGDSAECR